MSTGGLLIVFAALCAAGVVLALVVPRRRVPSLVAWLGACASVPLLVAGASALVAAPGPATVLWTMAGVGPLVVRADPMAGLFLVVTAVVFLAASWFTASSLPPLAERYDARAYAVMYFGLYASVAWVLVCADVFSFLVAWEIMSILCYLLVNFEHERVSHRRAAYLMLAMSEAGALAGAVGLLILAAHAGTLDFDGIRASSASLVGFTRTVVFLLTFFGFGVKAGLVPVNLWLPRAYASAPAPFIPVLAGATLDLGLYAIVRINADLLPAVTATPGLIALIVGTASALVGILYATTDNDLKRLLGHSSIENAGIITAGFGAAFVFTAVHLPALAAMALLVALYHLVNHSLYKTLLFIGAGVVGRATGTRDLDRLGGLVRVMPWTAAAILAGVLSIAALPPFNGFVSEWLTLQVMLRSAELPSVGVKIVFALCGAGLALTAALAVTCFVKVFAMGFLGMSRSDEAAGAREGGTSALGPMALLAALCLALGVLPTYAIIGLDRAVRPVASASGAATLVPPFFAGAAGHDSLPAAFVSEFHDLGAQIGQRVAPGPGLVIMHRGGVSNPVVFAASPTLLAIVLSGLLLVVFVIVRIAVARRRSVVRRVCWDGGIRRLLPEMTYTATGFSNPVRVIFQAIFRPTNVQDTADTVAEHFRTAIHRQDEAVYIVDRLLLTPLRDAMEAIAKTLARMHHGKLNAYIAYALGSLVAAVLGWAVFWSH